MHFFWSCYNKIKNLFYSSSSPLKQPDSSSQINTQPSLPPPTNQEKHSSTSHLPLEASHPILSKPDQKEEKDSCPHEHHLYLRADLVVSPCATQEPKPHEQQPPPIAPISYLEQKETTNDASSPVTETPAQKTVQSPPVYNPYRALPEPTKEQKSSIDIVLNSLTLDWLHLVTHTPMLQKKRRILEPLHPLKFLAYILSNSKNKENLRSISAAEGLAWVKFANEFGEKLTSKMSSSTFYAEVEGFAQEFSLDYSELIGCIRNKQWQQFIKILL